MDNLTKVNLIPQKNDKLLCIKLILLIRLSDLKGLPTATNYKIVDTIFRNINTSLSISKVSIRYVQTCCVVTNLLNMDSKLDAFNNLISNSNLIIMRGLIQLYATSWPLRRFSDSLLYNSRFKKSKFANKLSINTPDHLKGGLILNKKRISRKRNFFEKNKKKNKLKYLLRNVRFKSYKTLKYSTNFDNSNIFLKSSYRELKMGYRGRLFFKNSLHSYRKPKLIRDSKVFKGSTWTKVKKDMKSSNLLISDVYNYSSVYRKRLALSNLNSLTLLGFNNWVNTCGNDDLLFSPKSNLSKKQVKNSIAFASRFLTNPSDNLLKLSMSARLNSIEGRSLYLNQKSSLKLSAKRVLIFFIKSTLSKSLSYRSSTRSKIFNKLIKSSLFNTILNSKNIKFNKKSLLFNLFIQNYLTSKWESRKLRKRYRRKRIFFRFKKLAVEITKSIFFKKHKQYYTSISDLGALSGKVKSNSYRFAYRLVFRSVLKLLLKKSKIRSRYGKLRFMRLNSLISKNLNHKHLSNSNSILIAKSSLFSIDNKELIDQINNVLSIGDVSNTKSNYNNSKKNTTNIYLFKKYLKNLVNSKKYDNRGSTYAKKKNMHLRSSRGEDLSNVNDKGKTIAKRNRLSFISRLRSKKLIKLSKLNKLSLNKGKRLLNARLAKYNISSYSLFYAGRFLKRKLKKILKPVKVSKFSRGFFKKSFIKKKIRCKRRLPIFKPYLNVKVSNRSMFLNNLNSYKLSTHKSDKVDNKTRNAAVFKNIKQSLYKLNRFNQKKPLLKRKKNYESNFLNKYTSQKSNLMLHTNFLIKRTNPSNTIRVDSSKISYIKELFLRLPSRQINQELSKFIILGDKVSSYKNHKGLIYSDFIYKNVTNLKSSSRLDKFTINCLRNNTNLPSRIFNKVLYIKKKTILFFRRRRLLDQYLKQLATSRWSFKMSRLKRLAIMKLKSKKITSHENIKKSKSKPKRLVSKITELSIRLKKKKLKKIKDKLNSILIKKSKKLPKRLPRFKFFKKKRGLLKRFFIRSAYLKVANAKKFKIKVKSTIKRELSKSKKRIRREAAFQLPSYLKNTRLLARLRRKRWIRSVEISRVDDVSKKFFRFRRGKKKHTFRRNRYRIKTPLFIQKYVNLTVLNRFKRANSKLNTYNKFILSLKKKHNNRKRRYTSLPFLSKSLSHLRLINHSRLNNTAIKKLSRCPIKIKGKTKKKYFLSTLRIASKTDTRTPNISHTSLYKLFKPYKKHTNWSSNNLLKKKLKRVKIAFLKTKKNSNSIFYSSLKKKKRLLNLKFLNNIKISLRNKFTKNILFKLTPTNNLKSDTLSFKKQSNLVKTVNKSLLTSANKAWTESMFSKSELNKTSKLKKTNFKKTNFKKTNFKKTNFKKTNFKKTNFKKTNFKKKSKSFVFKRHTNNMLRLRVGRSFFRKFAIKYSIVDQLKFYNVNILKKKSISNNNMHTNIKHFYKNLLNNALASYNILTHYGNSAPVGQGKSTINNLKITNKSPVSLTSTNSVMLGKSKPKLSNKPKCDNLQGFNLRDSFVSSATASLGMLISQHLYKYSNGSIVNVQTTKKWSTVDTNFKISASRNVREKFTNFVLKYLCLLKGNNISGYSNHTHIDTISNAKNMNRLGSLHQSITKVNAMQSSSFTVKKLVDLSYNSVRFNSYNHLFNIIANQVYNDNLLVLSVDLLKYSLNNNQNVNQVSSKISDNLKFEFSKIAPTFFIDEAVSLIITSIRFKDTNLFMTWFTRFMYKLPIKKHKRAIAFLSKLFKLIYFSSLKDALCSTGVYFDIRGKIGVTGSKKKRHNSINLGKYSSTNKKLKWVTQKGVVVTTTGTLGVTFSIIY